VRLYSLNAATAVDDGGQHYEPADDGGFDFPDALGGRLHSSAVRGVKLWETDIERQRRLIADEAARRRDPATLLEAVEQIIMAAQGGAPAKPEPAAKTPAKAGAK
jgi:hypothetical protein